jgi:prepilin-type N-terminal cleavage/methylation domain-containing protein
MWAKQKQQTGFTIVELLIVIVVIAILAAITIVAFNGVQERARNTKTITAVKEYMKLYSAYAIDYDTYPGSGNYCLGTGYPGGLCWDNRTYTENTAANTGLSNYVSSLPMPSTTRVYRNATDGYRAGILFVNPYNLRYQLEGVNTQCGISGATRTFTAGESSGPECNVTVPDPAS